MAHLPDGETRSSFGAPVFAVVVLALMSYLTFAALQGEHGLFRLFQVEADEARLHATFAGLQAERSEIANLAGRLSVETLDLDLLDERARAVLGLARADELLIR